MTVHQDAYEVGEFARYLRGLVALLDPGSGWYGVFSRRDPAGMRACLDGAEIPPWDVVESLFQDLAAARGAQYAERESVRAADLYAASAAAHDHRAGGRQLLVERLELMTREQMRAAERLRASGSGSAADQDALAWARDDHERAFARCAELRRRLAAVAVPQGWFRDEGAEQARGAGRGPGRPRRADETPGAGGVIQQPSAPGAVPRQRRTPQGFPDTDPAPRTPPPAESAPHRYDPPPAWEPAPGPGDEPDARDPASVRPRQHPASAQPRPQPSPPLRRKKPRGARFAGLDVEDDDLASAVPVLPVPPTAAPAPRGARFGGATVRDDGGAHLAAEHTGPDPAALRAAADAVRALVALRAEGCSGEAHAVLCEAAGWSPDRLPVLAVELHRAGLDADWTTLLWEVSSLPPAELAAAAGALAAAGRPEDCGQLLRQGVARPAAEIADAVVALDRAGRTPQAQALLGAFVRARSPQDAARVAEGDPGRLVPHLLAAARAVSPAREWDLVHALRVAGIG